MNKFLLHITSLVALVLFLTMGACNNTPKTPILLEAEKTIEKQPDSALNYLGRVNSDLQDALQAQEYYLKALEIGEDSKDYTLLINIYNNLGTLYAHQDINDMALPMPELRNEALYYRAKAYTKQKADKKAMEDYRELAKDTRNPYGAEAKYQVAQSLYDAKEYAAAEKELLNYIEQSTPHAYWLARSFILLSDVYHATGKDLDARQYLLSLQQNYQGNDDIESMIESRLSKLKVEN